MDISSATDKKIYFESPSGIVSEKNAIFSTNGEDGKIRYVTIVNDLNVAGNWKAQGYVAMSNFQGKSTIVTFKVNPNLNYVPPAP